MSLSSEDTYDKGEFNEEENVLTWALATEGLTRNAPTKSSVSLAIDFKLLAPLIPGYQPLGIQAKAPPAPASHPASF